MSELEVRKKGRSRCRPRLEVLENRLVPAAVTFYGRVVEDLTGNGVTADDPGVAGWEFHTGFTYRQTFFNGESCVPGAEALFRTSGTSSATGLISLTVQYPEPVHGCGGWELPEYGLGDDPNEPQWFAFDPREPRRAFHEKSETPGWHEYAASIDHHPNLLIVTAVPDLDNAGFAKTTARVYRQTRISGVRFDDWNGDGVKQDSEPGIPGPGTDENGRFTNVNFEPRFYEYENTESVMFTAGGQFQIVSGQVKDDLTLGVFNKPTVTGTVFLDKNGDGVKDAGDDIPYLGSKVVLTNQTTGETRKVLADETGKYEFKFLMPGQYTVGIDTPDNEGLFLTKPLDQVLCNGNLRRFGFGGFSQSAFSFEGDFGVYVGHRISGRKFEDVNKNGKFDDGKDRPVPFARIEIDTCNDSLQGRHDLSTTTGEDGRFGFYVGPGTHKVWQKLGPGETATTPKNPPHYLVKIAGNEPNPPGLHFGVNTFQGCVAPRSGRSARAGEPQCIQGQVYLDTNGDGQRGSGDKAAANVIVFVDANGDRQLTQADLNACPEDARCVAVTDNKGKYTLQNVATGVIQVSPPILLNDEYKITQGKFGYVVGDVTPNFGLHKRGAVVACAADWGAIVLPDGPLNLDVYKDTFNPLASPPKLLRTKPAALGDVADEFLDGLLIRPAWDTLNDTVTDILDINFLVFESLAGHIKEKALYAYENPAQATGQGIYDFFAHGWESLKFLVMKPLEGVYYTYNDRQLAARALAMLFDKTVEGVSNTPREVIIDKTADYATSPAALFDFVATPIILSKAAKAGQFVLRGTKPTLPPLEGTLADEVAAQFERNVAALRAKTPPLDALRNLPEGTVLILEQLQAVGYTQKQIKALARIANKYKIKIGSRTTNVDSTRFIRDEIAGTKPVDVKAKTIDYRDTYLGFDNVDRGLVGYRRPVEPNLAEIRDPKLAEAVQKRYADRLEEFNNLQPEIDKLIAEGKVVRGKRVADGQYVAEAEGSLLLDAQTGKPIAGDIDLVYFKNLDGSLVTGEKYLKIVEELKQSDALIQHGAEMGLVEDLTRGLKPLSSEWKKAFKKAQELNAGLETNHHMGREIIVEMGPDAIMRRGPRLEFIPSNYRPPGNLCKKQEAT